MYLQGRNLRTQMQGEDIKLLQEELQLLGYQISEGELAENYFGNETEEAVLSFQQHNLEETGVVDEETAHLINQAVDGEQGQFVVRSVVQTENSEPVSGIVVRAFDKDLRREERLLAVMILHQLHLETPMRDSIKICLTV